MECNKNSLPSSGLQWLAGRAEPWPTERRTACKYARPAAQPPQTIQWSALQQGQPRDCWENSSWESRIQRKRVTSPSHRHAVNIRWETRMHLDSGEILTSKLLQRADSFYSTRSHLMLNCHTKMSRRSFPLKGRCSHVI